MSEEWTGKAVGHLQTHTQQCREDEEQRHLLALKQLEGVQTQTLHQRNLLFFLLQLTLRQRKAIGKEHKTQDS